MFVIFFQYFRFEVLYVERLHQKEQILNVNEEVAEENRDSVLGGEIAVKVFTAAVQQIKNDVEFVVSLFAVAAISPVKNVAEKIIG